MTPLHSVSVFPLANDFPCFGDFPISLGNPGSLLVPFPLSDSSQKGKVIEVTGHPASTLVPHSLFLLAKLHLYEPQCFHL